MQTCWFPSTSQKTQFHSWDARYSRVAVLPVTFKPINPQKLTGSLQKVLQTLFKGNSQNFSEKSGGSRQEWAPF